MKKITFKGFFVALTMLAGVTMSAQQKQKVGASQEVQLTEDNQRFLDEYGVVRCATVENEMLLKQRFPKRAKTNDFEEALAPFVAQIKADRAAGKAQMAVYNIPVVIHVMHNGEPVGTAPNITDAQAISQITVMNEDFRRMAGTRGGDNTTGAAVDVEINFCLAQQDENGNPTNGINRVNMGQDGINAASNGAALSAFNSIKPASQWDPEKYLNMWTVKFTGGASTLLGYAQFPDPAGTGVTGIGAGDVGPVGAANTDGVVASYDAFGTLDADDGSFIMNASYQLGRTMTHEVGHWLGLRHIWGDGGCGVDDFCADTPESDASNGGCPTTHVSCGTTDQVQNYMDYTVDSCMDTFTQDQKDRMQAIMAGSPRRMELNSSIGCQAANAAVSFATAGASEAEGSSCNTRAVNVSVDIALAPTGGNAIVTFSNTGTAVEGTDFDFATPTVTFTNGSAASQTMSLTIYEDSFVEGDDTIVVGMTISGTSDAAITTVGNDVYTLTLTNDDAARTTGGLTTIFSDSFEAHTDFEIGPSNGWTFNDADGDNTYSINAPITFPNQGYIGAGIVFNSTQVSGGTLSADWAGHTGDKLYAIFNATANISGNNPIRNEDHIFTPQINLNGTGSELKFWAKSIVDTYGLERFNVKISTTGTALGNFTAIQPTSHPAATPQLAPIAWTEYTYDLSAYDGQNVYVAIECVSQDAFAFMLDDVSVTTNISLNPETAVHAAQQNNLVTSGSIYVDNSTNYVADITNNNGVNYGCVDAFVSRASGASVMYQTAGVANYVMGKTYDIAPSSVQSGGNATVKFYFTAAEIAQWVSETGNLQGDLRIIKDNGISQEILGTTAGTYGAHVTLQGTSATGINGTYYFGVPASLGVSENQFNVFGVYPNPSNGEVTLSLSTNDDVDVSLFDIRGRKVYGKLHSNTADMFTDKLDFSSMASGVYMLDVQSGSKRAIKKLVIQ